MITHSAAKEIGKQKEQEVGWRLKIKGKWEGGGGKNLKKGGGTQYKGGLHKIGG